MDSLTIFGHELELLNSSYERPRLEELPENCNLTKPLCFLSQFCTQRNIKICSETFLLLQQKICEAQTKLQVEIRS